MTEPRTRFFEFEAPAPLLSMNQRASRTRRVYHQTWRDAAFLHYRNTFHRQLALPPCHVYISLPVTTKVRRDSANFQATVKPIVDGIQRAGAWPDDTDEFTEQCNPTFRKIAKGQPKVVYVRMIER
jgi:hypothetical protein